MAHPVKKLTQAAAGRAMSGKRYISFGSKGVSHDPPVRVTVSGGGRRVSVTGGGR